MLSIDNQQTIKLTINQLSKYLSRIVRFCTVLNIPREASCQLSLTREIERITSYPVPEY